MINGPGLYWARSSEHTRGYDMMLSVHNTKPPWVGSAWHIGSHLTETYGPGWHNLIVGPRATVPLDSIVVPSPEVWGDEACEKRLDKLWQERAQVANPTMYTRQFWNKAVEWANSHENKIWACACVDKLQQHFRKRLAAEDAHHARKFVKPIQTAINFTPDAL